jgi:hypothetical protein
MYWTWTIQATSVMERIPCAYLPPGLPKIYLLWTFFFDKNIGPAGDLSLVARGPSGSRHFLMVAKPPAACRLWEAHRPLHYFFYRKDGKRGCLRNRVTYLPHYRTLYTSQWGTRWRIWSRHYATSRKVAGSVPNRVIRIFHRIHTSGRSMALGSTQPLTVSTRNI